MTTEVNSFRVVKPNYFTWVLRMILFVMINLGFGYFMLHIVNREFDDAVWAAMYGFLLLLFFEVYMVLSLGGISKIKYDEESGEIRLYRLFKMHHLTVNELDGYFICTLHGRWKNFPGYLLVLKDGRVFEINEYNVKPLRKFYSLIVKSGIPCRGMKKSWYPFKRWMKW